MDNNPLTPRATSFSIASLITSDSCDDENALYHSLTNPTESNHNLNKITNDYYWNSIQQFRSATLIETNNEQDQQPITKRENYKQITNLQKSLTTTHHMEG